MAPHGALRQPTIARQRSPSGSVEDQVEPARAVGARVDSRGMHADEQLVVPGMRFFDFAKLEHVGRAVLILDYGFHDGRKFPFPFSPWLLSPSRLLLCGHSTVCKASISGP